MLVTKTELLDYFLLCLILPTRFRHVVLSLSICSAQCLTAHQIVCGHSLLKFSTRSWVAAYEHRDELGLFSIRSKSYVLDHIYVGFSGMVLA